MEEQKTSSECCVHAVCNLFNCIGDASFAIFPKEIAHNIGEMKKNVLSGIRWLVDMEIDWIDARVKGGDRLRQEWQHSRERASETAAGSGI